MERPASVEAYLASLSPTQRAVLDTLRAAIRSAAPDATEGISYSMAAFMHEGRGLVCYAAFKEHYSLFPMSTQVIADNLDALGARATGKGTIRFDYDERLPVALVKRIVKARLAEVEARKRR
ncbi:MAG TPA: DUF1801 domain-containing protein [Actinomycetota bacterium]|nr:DUF1801 domain-containing protein [Actinomycetota bacterium]